MSSDVGIVIPAFNEVETIADVVATARAHGVVFVVDDGSTDGTAAAARAVGAEVLIHPANQGYDTALKTGLVAAAGVGLSRLVTLDADGQHDPGVVLSAVEALENGPSDLAIGRRPQFARAAERWFGFYTRHRFGVPDIMCGVKAYRRADVLACRQALEGATIGTGLALALLRRGATASSFPVPIRARSGDSRFGRGLKANGRIAVAMARAVGADVAGR